MAASMMLSGAAAPDCTTSSELPGCARTPFPRWFRNAFWMSLSLAPREPSRSNSSISRELLPT